MRSILLKKERCKKTLNTMREIGLIIIIRYSNKRILSEKAILNYEYEVKYSRYRKPYKDEIYWKLYLELVLE